ncbi:hypothetical protein V5F72_13645 [Xanthobacter flavus]|uniref:hypothetical protein n=1 Tax=Xanthobacter flavus TaxID=281 RepID=UPI00372B5959
MADEDTTHPTAPDSLTARTPLELDIAAAAHRKLLVLALQLMARDEVLRAALVEAVSQKLTFHDSHEDAGLEADAAFAFERRVDEEFRRVLFDVQAVLGEEMRSPVA